MNCLYAQHAGGPCGPDCKLNPVNADDAFLSYQKRVNMQHAAATERLLAIAHNELAIERQRADDETRRADICDAAAKAAIARADAAEAHANRLVDVATERADDAEDMLRRVTVYRNEWADLAMRAELIASNTRASIVEWLRTKQGEIFLAQDIEEKADLASDPDSTHDTEPTGTP